MSKKFTGITSAGSAIPVYDKDAHSALQNKADVSALTAYQPVGEYYSASNPSGFLTAVPAEYATSGDLEDLSTAIAETFQPKSAMTAYLTAVPEGYATVEDVESATSGLQEKGDYYSASNPSGFITGVDLTPYQTIEGMTAYQPVGEYYSASNPSGFITGVDLTPYQEKSGMSAYQEKGDYYSASNPSGFISTIPDTYLQNTDLTIVDNKVTEISGVPLSAGDELPATVMDTSGLEYNSQGYINGYNGSAVATIDQERQWFTHDDTLCHVSNSAQYALGVNMSAISADLARMMGVDETVLFTTASTAATTDDVILSESRQNFERLQIYAKDDNGNMFTFDMFSDVSAVRGMGSYNAGAQWIGMRAEEIQAANDTTLTVSDTPQMSWTSAGAFRNFGHGKYLKINKVVGIHRISGGN